MKRILLPIMILAATLVSCSKILDEISPKHAISSDKVGAEDLGKLTNGVLYTMEGYVNSGWFDGDKMGENFRNGPGGAALVDVLLMTPSTPDVLSRWQKHMTSLRQVNELLAAATGSTPADANARKTAYFSRALIYFGLYTRWGTAPILEKTTNEEVPLSSGEKVLDFIISDLDNALGEPATSEGCFYVTDDAVNALRAKALLWAGRNTEAAAAAASVIANHSAVTTSKALAETWINGTSSPEIVFALANKRTDGQITLYTSTNDTDGSWNYSIPDDLFGSLFGDVSGLKSGDIRKNAVQTDADKNRILKFPNGIDELNQFVANPDPAQSPLVILRAAEMHLVKAEAEGNTAAGHATLEAFMKTRYEEVSLPSSMTDRQWQDLLLDEYRREFYGEGHRWFDVKRMGRLDLFKTLDGRDYLLLWPIPQHEIDLLKDKSAYPQNPGYTGSNGK